MNKNFNREQQKRNIKKLLENQNKNRPLTKRELDHALTFLLSSGVIDSKQFTEYLTKALPFTQG